MVVAAQEVAVWSSYPKGPEFISRISSPAPSPIKKFKCCADVRLLNFESQLQLHKLHKLHKHHLSQDSNPGPVESTHSFLYSGSISQRSYRVGRAGIRDGLLDEVVGDDPGRLLVEEGVHQRDPGGAAASLGLRRARL